MEIDHDNILMIDRQDTENYFKIIEELKAHLD
jgi:hypothetical protein